MKHLGKCRKPGICNEKTKPSDLCTSCNGWFQELKKHKSGKNHSWHKNCNSEKWSDHEGHWEIAKFFMPPLGSTDLSSLLNVLEWLKDPVFLGKPRVKVDLVGKLRSEVRNTWAHASQHELTDDKKNEGFSIAIDFLEDLEKVSNTENTKYLEYLKHLKVNNVTNVAECELQSLLLQRQLLNEIKEEITTIKDEQLVDKSAIEENQQKLMKLEAL